jgi:hypothetical protein
MNRLYTGLRNFAAPVTLAATLLGSSGCTTTRDTVGPQLYGINASHVDESSFFALDRQRTLEAKLNSESEKQYVGEEVDPNAWQNAAEALLQRQDAFEEYRKPAEKMNQISPMTRVHSDGQVEKNLGTSLGGPAYKSLGLDDKLNTTKTFYVPGIDEIESITLAYDSSKHDEVFLHANVGRTIKSGWAANTPVIYFTVDGKSDVDNVSETYTDNTGVVKMAVNTSAAAVGTGLTGGSMGPPLIATALVGGIQELVRFSKTEPRPLPLARKMSENDHERELTRTEQTFMAYALNQQVKDANEMRKLISDIFVTDIDDGIRAYVAISAPPTTEYHTATDEVLNVTFASNPTLIDRNFIFIWGKGSTKTEALQFGGDNLQSGPGVGGVLPGGPQ